MILQLHTAIFIAVNYLSASVMTSTRVKKYVGKHNKILIVDDAIEMVKILQTLLETNGYEVETAFHGLQGMEKLKVFEPDLIILDMDMPRMGGIAFYHEICHLSDGSPKYPVLIFTGRGGLQTVFKDLKVEGFMTKPFELDALQAKIDQVFKRRYGDEKQAPSSSPGKILAPKKVLVIDGDQENFDKLVIALMNGGYEVVGVLNGAEGMNADAERKVMRSLQMDSPDIVTLKIESMNPLSREFQLAAKLLEKTKPAGIPVLLYGGAHFTMDENLARQITESSGIRKVLPNSNPDSLLQEINEAVKGR